MITLNIRGKNQEYNKCDFDKSKLIQNIKKDVVDNDTPIGPLDIDTEILPFYLQAVRNLTVTELMKFIYIAILLEDDSALNRLNKKYIKKFNGWTCFESCLKCICEEELENSTVKVCVKNSLFLLREMVACLSLDDITLSQSGRSDVVSDVYVGNDINKEDVCTKIAQYFRNYKIATVIVVNWDDDEFMDKIREIIRDIHPDYKNKIIEEMSRGLPRVHVMEYEQQICDTTGFYVETFIMPPYIKGCEDHRVYLNNYAEHLGLGYDDRVMFRRNSSDKNPKINEHKSSQIMDGLYVTEYSINSGNPRIDCIEIYDDILDGEGEFSLSRIHSKYRKDIEKCCIFMLAIDRCTFNLFVFKGEKIKQYVSEHYLANDVFSSRYAGQIINVYCHVWYLNNTFTKVEMDIKKTEKEFYAVLRIQR